jgi:hypothetical protein
LRVLSIDLLKVGQPYAKYGIVLAHKRFTPKNIAQLHDAIS